MAVNPNQLQEIVFGPNVTVRAHIRLSERDVLANRKLLRATLAQPGLTELAISEMLPQDLDASLVRLSSSYLWTQILLSYTAWHAHSASLPA